MKSKKAINEHITARRKIEMENKQFIERFKDEYQEDKLGTLEKYLIDNLFDKEVINGCTIQSTKANESKLFMLILINAIRKKFD